MQLLENHTRDLQLFKECVSGKYTGYLVTRKMFHFLVFTATSYGGAWFNSPLIFLTPEELQAAKLCSLVLQASIKATQNPKSVITSCASQQHSLVRVYYVPSDAVPLQKSCKPPNCVINRSIAVKQCAKGSFTYCFSQRHLKVRPSYVSTVALSLLEIFNNRNLRFPTSYKLPVDKLCDLGTYTGYLKSKELFHFPCFTATSCKVQLHFCPSFSTS